ncbi:MAG: hypothetical protein KGY41_03810 [Desulfovermiculus sp.]|nr:hypothetical protein [Desulfovermiculus sp.]
MKMVFRKIEALIMASTYAQAGAREAAMDCLQAVYSPQVQKSKQPQNQKKQRPQLRV